MIRGAQNGESRIAKSGLPVQTATALKSLRLVDVTNAHYSRSTRCQVFQGSDNRNLKMSHYIVSYDLHHERHYPPVWAALNKMGATRLLESLWVLSSNLTTVQVCEAVKAAADSDDSVAVIELKPEPHWAAVRAKQPGIDWLRRNISA
jgi:hypothetical protein